MAFSAQSRGRPAGVVTVAELLRRVSGSRAARDLPEPPQPSDQVWVGTLLRREGVSPQEALGTSTAPNDERPHPLKKAAVTAGALLAVGALGVSAVVVTTSHDGSYPGQGLLDGLTPAQLGQLPLDAAAAAAGAGANLFTALVPGILPEAAALISGAVNATLNAIGGASGLPFVPGLPSSPAASDATGGSVSPSASAAAGGGGTGSNPGGGAAPASSGPVDNTVGTAGRTVGGTTTSVGSALPQPVGQPVQQLGGAVSNTSTGVATTADGVVAPVGSVLGGLTR